MQAALQWCRSTFEALRVPSVRPRRALKRQTDLVLGIALLILTAPLVAIAAVLVRLNSPGPVVFRQTRVGLDGREFEVFKLRSMIADAEQNTGPIWAAQNDARVTAVGRILRKYRIDELPQLVNVLNGEMSLVGPRPERPAFVQQLSESIPHFELRTRVLPGITGLAQIETGYGRSRADSEEKLKHDMEYVRSASVTLDLLILMRTIRVVLRG
ncbi:MAG: sugar transferase, partial [Actinobacteria bacterium]